MRGIKSCSLPEPKPDEMRLNARLQPLKPPPRLRHRMIHPYPYRRPYLARPGPCPNAGPTDPRVFQASADVHQHHHAPSLLPISGQSVPPDPTVLALGQPMLAAITYAVREVFLHVALPLLLLWLLQRWLGHIEERTREETSRAASLASRSTTQLPLLREVAALLPGAASLPSRVALTLLTATHVARSAANIAQGLAERALLHAGEAAPYDILRHGRAVQAVSSLKGLLARVDQVLIVAYQVLLVVFGCWVLLSWKDVAVSRLLLRQHNTAQGRQELERIITPLNSVATWALLVAAALMVVELVGVDVRPLLVLTGGGSIVAGLASQQLLANAVSGIQMYLDRPFQVGDTISLMSGVTSYVGEVVEVAALRTHLALEDGSTVAIPNRALADMIITNKSRRGKRMSRPPWMQSRAPLSLQLRVRLQPPDNSSVVGQLGELRDVIVRSGAVEEEGLAAPRVEVLGYSERGVEVLARCRLRNPAKVVAEATSGSAVGIPQQLVPATAQAAHAGNGSGQGSSSAGQQPAGAQLVRQAAAQGTASAAARDGADSAARGDGSSGGARATAMSRDDVPRALRQQLLLALGPWLQTNNATLKVE